MFERFTTKARNVVVAAQTHARELRHSEIGPQHLLLGLLDDSDSVAARVLHGLGVDEPALRERVAASESPDAEALKSLGIDLDQVRRQAEQAFGPGALDRPRRQRRGLFGHRNDGGGHLPFTREAKSSLELSLKEALARKDGYIGTEHLLLGVLGTEQGSARRVLGEVGVPTDVAVIRQLVNEELRRSA
jgi:ATP-dependent Clp protease ATP-binding subunit ClpA